MNLHEQLAFLKTLQQELNTQDHDGQAEPRFWVVYDYKKEPCWDGQAESWDVVLDDGEVHGTCEDVKAHLCEGDYLDNLDVATRSEFDAIDDGDALCIWIEKHLKLDANIVPIHEIGFIRQDTFFLTKRECQAHIDRNRHNYGAKAHTYAMTALQAPQVATLWRILETLDIDALQQLVATAATK